jgi:raffinose/stachyose/melibiose transport system substrate-binding protein
MSTNPNPAKSGKALRVILALVLIAAVVFGIVVNGQKNDWEKKAKDFEAQVVQLKDEVAKANEAATKAAEEAAAATEKADAATAEVERLTAEAEAAAKAAEEAAAKAAEEAAAKAAEEAAAQAEEPAAEEPATEEPATEEPATEEPATEEPAAEETTEQAATAEAEDKVNFSVFQLKVEIDPMIQAFAKLYNEKHPQVNVTVETLGGGADYGGALKAKLAADQMPTIFMIEGQGGYDLWKDYIADMSEADWVKDTDLAFYSPEGKAVGFPIAMEGFGLGYNAEILEKAGIDPASLTTFSAVKAAFEKLDGMKEELGLDSVTSVGTSVSGGLWWVTSQHVFNSFYAGYQDYNDSSFYDALRKGEVDKERLTAFANYLKLLYDYADQNVLQNGNYDAQVAAFASGKAAFITQGNWIDPNLKQLGATFPMGYISHNFLEQESTGLYMAAPSWFAVNAKATPEQQKAAVDFLNYMALTEDGHNYMVAEAGMVPAFKSVKLLPAGPLSSALTKAGAPTDGNYNWYFGQNPDGFNQGTLGPIFELLATGISVDEFVQLVTDAFLEIVPK